MTILTEVQCIGENIFYDGEYKEIMRLSIIILFFLFPNYSNLPKYLLAAPRDLGFGWNIIYFPNRKMLQVVNFSQQILQSVTSSHKAVST